jgi:hypothetical protein
MKTTKSLLFMIALVILVGTIGLAAGPAFATYENKVKPGEFVIEPPTLISLGFEWYIEGDDNRDATVEVWYREIGDGAWKKGLPLLRLQYEKVNTYVAPNMFAGSIFDLEPDTKYECKFIMSDPDGVRGVDDKIVTVRTRAEPMPFEGGRTLHVYPYGYAGAKEQPAFTGLKRAYAGVEPGDIIMVHAGLYENDYATYMSARGSGSNFFGIYRLNKSGTPEKPIVIKAAGDGEVIFDGNGCSSLFDVTLADYNYFEGLTIRNTDIGIYAGLRDVGGCSGLTVKRCRFENVGQGIWGSYLGSMNHYYADNVILGRDNPEILTGWIARCIPWDKEPGYPQPVAGPNGSYYGITVSGQGHVVCHNYVAYFHDAISIDQEAGVPEEGQSIGPPLSIDFYNNSISHVADNCFETDTGTHNIRVFRNLCINHAHASLSSQPTYGGPAYFIRNIVYHAPERGSIKMYSNPAGVIFYHNTLCAEANVGQPSVMTGASNLHFRNNLILGENPNSQNNFIPNDFRGIFFMDTYTSYSTSDYNGFRPNEGFEMQFVWNSPAAGVMRDYLNPREVHVFKTLEEMCNATGQECHGILVDYDIFENVAKADLVDFTKVYRAEDLDFRLKEGTVAVDAGCILPNVNDDFTGQAPDLGALERGRPVPIYGPRPQ